MIRVGQRPYLEDALCLSLPRLLKYRQVVPGQETSGELIWAPMDSGMGPVHEIRVLYSAELGNADGSLNLEIAQTGMVILLSTTPNHFGGLNWYVHCPVTGRRARDLYLWPGMSTFCHREAIDPPPIYRSQRVGMQERLRSKRIAVRRRLGERYTDLSEIPFRPKGMHHGTYLRIISRDLELRALEAANLEVLLGRLTAG